MTTTEEKILSDRLQKLEAVEAAGINPYPHKFDLTHTAKMIAEEGMTVRIAGRLVLKREMGKASFAHLQDSTGRIQIYCREDILGSEVYAMFRNLVDLGDHLGISGEVFRTRTGELTVKAKELRLLGKSLKPLPEKWHGLTDTEDRFRQRELDLISNQDSKDRLVKRSRIISALRSKLNELEFLEVETPMMQTVASGALAKPFNTHHNALDMNLYLRIAPELYLKRLLVGGLDKVYEIGKCFRNEGVDTRHNPEFTILEAYQAYGDCMSVMNLTETLINEAAKAIDVKLPSPFERISLVELFQKHTGFDMVEATTKGTWKNIAKDRGLLDDEKTPERKCFERLFDAVVIPVLHHTSVPVFIMDYPSKFSPLAKVKPDNPYLAERFELFINGEEVANAYSEQNNPIEQRQQLTNQMSFRDSGDDESMLKDEAFLTALEYGMPPAGGLGIGIDRLCMVLTNTKSIREVIYFPLLRPAQ